MRVPSKIHNFQLVQIQPEERLAATSELNLALSLVTGWGEARGRGYWAATQVKGLSPEILFVSEADVVHLTESCTLIVGSPNLQSWNIAWSSGTWQCDENPTGSETVAHAKHFDQPFLKFDMGTQEAQSVLPCGVCAIKPINGKMVQTTLWKLRSVLIKLFKSSTDQLIVLTKQGNACGWKGLAGGPLGQRHIFCTQRQFTDVNKTELITYPEIGRAVLLKSRMRENLKSGSLRGLIAASGRRWL